MRRVYEYRECRVRPGSWEVDAGACEGFFSLYALQKGANVLASEPMPELARALEGTLAEFIRAGRVKIFPLTLGQRAEEKMLYIYHDSVGRSTINMEVLNVQGDGIEVVRQEKVSVIPSDLLLRDDLIPHYLIVERYKCGLILKTQVAIRHCLAFLRVDERRKQRLKVSWA